MKVRTSGTNKIKLYVIISIITVTVFVCAVIFPLFSAVMARAEGNMPFYNLAPKEIVLRSNFSTNYTSSTDNRKWNIKTATKSINNTLVDVGAEFSFNQTVGLRTEARGYKVAKIIKDGIFVDGVGGGVCQVSTTLYNALILADLKITEYHPHSLSVSYVAPSFDAMVNSGSADLRFVNNTKNPIIIKGNATDSTVSFEIYGEKLDYKITRKSVITEKVSPPETQVIFGKIEDYPALSEFKEIFINYPKEGTRSEGYIVKSINNKVVSTKKIRNDYYKAIRGVVVKLLEPQDTEQQDDVQLNWAT